MTLIDQIGLTGPAYEVDIERGKIREFALAMAAPLPEFLEHEYPIIPATFLVSAPYTWGYTLERPRGTVFDTIEHDLTVSLHAEEAFQFYGEPPRAGDRLIAQPQLEKVWHKQGKNGGKLTFLTILNQYRNKQNELIAEQRSTSVTTETAPDDEEWQVSIPDYKPDYPELERQSIFSEINRRSFHELEAGDSPGTVQAAPLLKQEIVRFQGVVGEDDPLHHDTQWAQQQGYPEVFALGTHQASLMAAYAGFWLPPEAVRSFRVRFHDLAWPGDVLNYTGTVIECNSQQKKLCIHLTCQRQGGTLVDQAWMDYDFLDKFKIIGS